MAIIVGEVTRIELAPAAALFRSLGDPTRLAILRRLALGEARVGELVEEVGLAQSTVSKHLACLKDCGLVDSEPVGRASLFRLSQPALIDLLAAAETVLQAGGQAVALCPSYGIDSHGTGAIVNRGVIKGGEAGIFGQIWADVKNFGTLGGHIAVAFNGATR